jgi:hypothetical protein
MEEDIDDESQPESEQPRFLLPEGCGDLIDALRLQGKVSPAARHRSQGGPAANIRTESLPTSVSIPELISVKELAAAMHLHPNALVDSLMALNIFATIQTPLTFDLASELCARHGVRADRLPDPPA